MDALKRLEGAGNYRLILLVAPSGSGKTALLQRWASQLRERQTRVAWMDLRAADNEAPVFLQDLTAALSQINKACGYAQVLVEGQAGLLESIAGLINALADGPQEDYFLVLDSYQRITSTAVHEAVQLLLDYPPPCMHIVLAARSTPPLQIARLRVRRQMLEIVNELPPGPDRSSPGPPGSAPG